MYLGKGRGTSYLKLLNMKYFIINLFILVISGNLISQDPNKPCNYIPLEFEEIKPLWTHLVIDSTFIGHIDTSGQWRQFYYDGMDQFTRDGGSFIKDGYLYSITNADYDLDLSGYYIEKIDLESQQVLWEIRTDLRHVENREKALGFKVVDNKFIFYGVRTFWDEADLSIAFLRAGFVPSLYYIREYDDYTGELLYHYTPQNEDSNAIILKSTYNVDYLIEISQSEYDYFKILNHIDRGYFITKTEVNNLGYQISSTDTVIVGLLNNLDYRQSYFKGTNHFIKYEDSYFFLEQYMPKDDSSDLRQGLISKYNSEFELVKTWEIKDIGISDFSLLTIKKIRDGKLILQGCSNLNPNAFCKLFFVVLDTDLNFIKYNEGIYNDIYLHFINVGGTNISDSDDLFLWDRQLLESTNSNISLYKSNDNESMDSLIRLTIKEKDWVGFVDVAFVLTDGDYLVKINHSCFIDGKKRSWHPVWMRFKAEDLNLIISSIEDFNHQDDFRLFPNPSSDLINIAGMEVENIVAIEIYNSLGKLVKSVVTDGNPMIKINVSELESGNYFSRIILKNGSQSVTIFIKI